MYTYSPHINPGKLEIFAGPMCSGKTREILNRIDQLNYIKSCSYVLIKPRMDNRSVGVKTRFGSLQFDCRVVDETNSADILNLVKDEHQVVAIDEGQFFESGLIRVVDNLLKRNVNVLVSGLDLNFRGEGFGCMPELLARAHSVHKLTAVCVYPNCGEVATRSQRLIGGNPAHYNTPVIYVGDTLEGYEPRCVRHHEVPGKPL